MSERRLAYVHQVDDNTVILGLIKMNTGKVEEEYLKDIINYEGKDKFEYCGAVIVKKGNTVAIKCDECVTYYVGDEQLNGTVYIGEYTTIKEGATRHSVFYRKHKRGACSKPEEFQRMVADGSLEVPEGEQIIYVGEECANHAIFEEEFSGACVQLEMVIPEPDKTEKVNPADIVDIFSIKNENEKASSIYERYGVTPNPNCIRCKGDGSYIDGGFGIEVTCDCVISQINREKEVKPTKPVYHTTKGVAEIAVAKGLIPAERINDEFSVETAMNRISAQYGSRYTIKNFKAYEETLSTIMTSICTGIPIGKSYMIGGPNGSGKTTFANTCIKRLESMSRKAVPYVSLMELADLRVRYEKQLNGWLDKKKSYSDEDSDRIDFTWADYVKADVVFTYLSGIDNASVEVKILRTLLNMRGSKGLPTIVFREESLELYRSDAKMRLYYWDEIISRNENLDGYDRLTNVYFMKAEKTIGLVKGEDY